MSVADVPFSAAWPLPAGVLWPAALEPPGSAGLEIDSTEMGGEPDPVGTDQPAEAKVATAGEDAPAAEGGAPPPTEPDSPADGPRAALRRYESAVLRVITDALRAIEGGAPLASISAAPAPAERAEAFGALDALVAAGELTAEAAAVHRSLLVTASEAGPRLRSLLELRSAGYLADDDLDRKRRQIVAPLAELLAR